MRGLFMFVLPRRVEVGGRRNVGEREIRSMLRRANVARPHHGDSRLARSSARAGQGQPRFEDVPSAPGRAASMTRTTAPLMPLPAPPWLRRTVHMGARAPAMSLTRPVGEPHCSHHQGRATRAVKGKSVALARRGVGDAP